MPFLRRRGNMASEADVGHQAATTTTTTSSGTNTNTANGRPSAEVDVHHHTRASEASSTPTETELSDNSHPSTPPSRQNGSHPPTRPHSPPIQEQSEKHRRFSTLRFRNASDSQLSIRHKQHAESAPPVPTPPPNIITTAPTMDIAPMPIQKKTSRINLTSRFRRPAAATKPPDSGSKNGQAKRTRKSTSNDTPFHTSELPPLPLTPAQHHPVHPADLRTDSNGNGNGTGTAVPQPDNRISESSRSDASSTDHGLYASSTNHTVHSFTTTFFRLPRRKPKAPEPLFPLGHLPQQGKKSSAEISHDGASTSSLTVPWSSHGNSGTDTPLSGPGTPRASSSHSTTTANPSSPEPRANITSSPAKAFFRHDSTNSPRTSTTRAPAHLRGRSSTVSSVGDRSLHEEGLSLPVPRTSMSAGRKSFGDLFSLGRKNTELGLGRQGTMTPATPGSSTSKNNSLHLIREQVVLPERREDDTPAKYLARLEEVVSRSAIASLLSRETDAFSAAVLRSYMRTFSFFGNPIDMALRKLLMEAELPRETQQIDRCLQSFANRYDECNPGVYSTPDQAYFTAFSLLILHTDVFNKNNKRKMQKIDYLKNTGGEGIFDDILECFYDNITYTPFIRVEDDVDINGERASAQKTRRKPIFAGGPGELVKHSSKEPLDPYALIIDGKLDVLRPNLKDVMHLEDHYSYLGTAKCLDLKELQRTFFKTAVLQIVSARSRPDAFMSEKTATNPQESHPGIVDIKITKVGLLWRKDAKRSKTRSKWQEWGAILTGAQLYFFRDTAWVKSLMHQYEAHAKQGNDVLPVIFEPPLEQFKPDILFSTDGAVALVDSTYKKHKHAFVYVRHGGIEEILLADDEAEMNDWLAKLNYAAAFRTSGVRMRGVNGGHYEGQIRRGIRRFDTNSDATQLVQTPTGEVSIARGGIDPKMANDISAARREVMMQKVAEADEKVSAAEKQLELQLRNARHLQIMAPIQAKTREHILLAAARTSAQLKWTRMEIWRLRCHRDILAQDLEEEQQSIGHTASVGTASIAEDAQRLGEQGGAAPGRPGSAHSSQPPAPAEPATDDDPTKSPQGSARDGPPRTQLKSATRPRRRSETASVRKSSLSSSVISTSPPGTTASLGKIGLKDWGNTSSPSSEMETQGDVDESERDLLEQTGLVRTRSRRVSDSHPSTTSADAGEWREHANNSDKHDKSKIRRSLQRTLREGAGHLSPQRSRKGKDVQGGSLNEEGTDRRLTRGVGSFVVHGKKASVINFGSELQSMSNDEKMRAMQQARRDDQPPSPTLMQATSPSSEDEDFHSVMGDTRQWKERRESATSASTATARSFRELHRKYSRSASASARLAVPSDDDSDAALSFSEGRRTPLPPIEPEPNSDEEDGTAGPVQRRSEYFTPTEEPTSPVSYEENDRGREPTRAAVA
ncbi:related to sec7-domain protein [Cephalotrichum gorgonifer]|uniref:Related to sec7-domain protein n=1 Tax=Cephalotrichum gorgonifer TaxID=2041049 RepID=A0AAE8MRS9_9PEZI|nr:related to sec7-domain protein [Cephalotrichum gorgonifer]